VAKLERAFVRIIRALYEFGQLKKKERELAEKQDQFDQQYGRGAYSALTKEQEEAHSPKPKRRKKRRKTTRSTPTARARILLSKSGWEKMILETLRSTNRQEMSEAAIKQHLIQTRHLEPTLFRGHGFRNALRSLQKAVRISKRGKRFVLLRTILVGSRN
jgi:hypothetical protein